MEFLCRILIKKFFLKNAQSITKSSVYIGCAKINVCQHFSNTWSLGENLKKYGKWKRFVRLLTTLSMIFLAATASAENIYDACLECNEQQVRTKVFQDLQSKICPVSGTCSQTYNEPIYHANYHVFTDQGPDKGIVFTGTVIDQRVILFRRPPPTQDSRSYFNELSWLRIAVNSMMTAINDSLESLTGVKNGELGTIINDYKVNPDGECDNSDNMDSPLDYFKEGTRHTIDSYIRDQADAYSPEINARVGNISGTIGTSSSIGVQIVLSDAPSFARMSFVNGGQLVFDLTRVGFGYEARLNLNGSRIGNGYSAGINPPLSSFFDQSGNSYQPVNQSNQFQDTCLAKDFEEALENLGVEIDFEGDSDGAFDSDSEDSWRGCHDVQYHSTQQQFTWSTYEMVMTLRKGVATFTRVRIDHHLAVNSDNGRRPSHPNCD